MTMQAKDLNDDAIVFTIERIELATGHWVCWWDMPEPYAGLPRKLMLAKMRKLILKGRIDGCTCGCRGDFTVLHNPRRQPGSLLTLKRDET